MSCSFKATARNRLVKQFEKGDRIEKAKGGCLGRHRHHIIIVTDTLTATAGSGYVIVAAGEVWG